MVIVDTTVWIDFLAGAQNAETSWCYRELGRTRLGMIDLILSEVLQGIRHEAAFRLARQQLSKFAVFNTGGADFAIAAAQNYRFLRQRGCTVRKTIDCYIATFCISGGHHLLHRDRDFDPFEQHMALRVIHP